MLHEKGGLLLDQRGVNGQEVKLLEGPFARLPAGWQFTDLRLGSNECFRVSASNLSILRLLGSLASKGRSRSGWAASSLARLLTSLGHLWRRAVKHAKSMVLQLRNYMAATELLHRWIAAPWILPSKLTGTSYALLEPFSHKGQCWEASPSSAPV